GLEGNELALTLELPEEPVWVVGDRMRLSQILANLLSNAAKFTESGGKVRVRVAADLVKQRASVFVRDTGIGIAPEILPLVFETFCQGEHGLDRRRGGLGLGLALVKGLAELHGGGVQADSAGPGQGAELAFWLPLGKKPEVPVPMPSPSVSGGRRLRILIV